ncbi:DUF3857 domain-containing protein [Hymenobacter yonginensis]|uniref:DUF3857 domain-containing protein n=1 Tax=Hymenobacter yonginensis TaxID=748197 RepID=A0ABY7PPC3_9BACT|nr:DUF3857 domain-containing protein [Hymenobacter yonginensis]WBO84919.1 DUF3857 domain-containing protein [Hymenobacter yonginensis]
MTIFLRLLLMLLGVSVATPAFAQQAPAPPIKFGSVRSTDFVPAPAASDTAAAVAEYLCDYGTSRLVGGNDKFQVLFERTTRLQIHRKAGYSYATVRVPLYTRDGQYERLTNLKGSTYNLQDGRVVQTKLAADPAFREQLDKNHVLMSFTMPAVREGSIVEFSYTITSDFIFNLQDWQFEHSIPVRWSEYRATLPQFYHYKTITRGYLPFAVKEETVVPYTTTYSSRPQGLAPGQDSHLSALALQLRWVMKDVPAFRTEPFLTTPHDYMRSVHFELAGTDFTGHDYQDVTGKWPALWKVLEKEEHFGLLLSGRSPLAAAAKTLRQQHDDPKDRAAAVLALVQRTVKHNGKTALFGSQPVRRTLELRLGNTADVNLLLVSTLRAAGLTATPLLLSTRGHGQMQQLVPALSQFNYVAAHVQLPDSSDLLLDATEPQLPAGLLPERCLNGQGCLADASGRWLTIRPAARHLEFRTAKLHLTEQGALDGSLKLEYQGYAGLEARRSIRQTSVADYLASLQRQWTEWQPAPPKLLLSDSAQAAVAVEMALHLPAPDNPQATLLYLPVMRLLGAVPYQFRAPTRHYPVDFAMPHEYTSLVTLTLPPGTTVQELPASVVLALPNAGGRFQYQVTQLNPETVQFMARLQLSRAEYSPAEYAALRELHQQAAAKCGEMLVLSRK